MTSLISKGEIFGLLGPNGAGKSTTILMMLGLTEPDAGSVRVCGLDPTADPVGVKRMVGYLPEEVGFYDDLTGMENLTYTARLNGFASFCRCAEGGGNCWNGLGTGSRER
ncbi:MAG: ATP-binding cassette domain-containing protein [Marinilabiliales bacterium]|nr:ATP-binding cassette domain-containing protein [Marinilabiliales bacterium]